MRKTLKSLFFRMALPLGLLLSHSAQAAPMCFQAHNKEAILKAELATPAPKFLDRFSIAVLDIVRTLTKSTTSLRQEVKYVVNVNQGNAEIQSLFQHFGQAMAMRDIAPEGLRNITSTFYLNIAKYQAPNGEEKSVKLRFRRYFTASVKDPERKRMTVAKGFEEQAWMEIKIQHPWFKWVVTKLRVKIWNKDIPKLIDDSFFNFESPIRQRMIDIAVAEEKKASAKMASKGEPRSEEAEAKKINERLGEIERALKFLSELYSNPARRVSNLFAHTEYERDSYSIKVPHRTDPKKFIEVQITADQKVAATRLIDEESFNAYGPDQIVYELKIPLQFAELTDADIAEYPGLARVKEFKAWLATHHDPKFPENKGKVSKVDTRINTIIYDRREANESILEYLRRRGWIP